MSASSPSTPPVTAVGSLHVTFGEAVGVWAKIGLLSFGGPAGQVALMHQELVERRRWIDEERFLHALNYCVILNLSIWFALHVVFKHVEAQHFGPLRALVPSLTSVDPAALTLAVLALLAIFRFKLGLPKTLAASAVLGLVWKLATLA